MRKDRTELQQLRRLLLEKSSFLLTSHQDPDGDSIGSLIGFDRCLKNLGKQTVIYNQGKTPNKYRFLDPDGAIINSNTRPPFSPQVALVLECPKFERIGFVKDLITPDMTIVNIDHHNDNEMFGSINIVDDKACAVAEIIYELFKDAGFEITSDVANPLYAAMVSDTGCFKFANTNSKCLQIAAELVEMGAKPKFIADNIFSSHDAETLKLLGYVLENLELYAGGKICVFRLTRKEPARFGAAMENSEGIIDYSMMINNVKVGILFRESVSGTTKISLRSQDTVDIGAYAKEKGGGGHPNAAGFTYQGNMDEAIKTIVAEVTESLHD
jgi:bifunctional oligoribonuclease and PAP phosphatase NrnA